MGRVKRNHNLSVGEEEKPTVSAADFLTMGLFSGLTIGGGVILGYGIGNITKTGFLSVMGGLILGLLIVLLWFYRKIRGYIK